MNAVFRTQRRVEFADTDVAGIVHFANFFRYMEEAEHAFLRSRGLSVMMTWDGERIGFPRVSATCDFTKSARFEDVIDVVVRIDRLGTKSIAYAVEFFLGEELLARGKLTCVCCRLGEERLVSVPIPAGVRARLEGPPV